MGREGIGKGREPRKGRGGEGGRKEEGGRERKGFISRILLFEPWQLCGSGDEGKRQFKPPNPTVSPLFFVLSLLQFYGDLTHN